MKVKELIKQLKKYNKNNTVFVGTFKNCENDRDIIQVDREANKEVIIIIES